MEPWNDTDMSYINKDQFLKPGELLSDTNRILLKIYIPVCVFFIGIALNFKLFQVFFDKRNVLIFQTIEIS